MRSALAIIAAGVMLCSCAELTGAAASTQKTADQALYVAEAAFKGASVGLDGAVKSGALHGTPAATARTYYDQSHDALVKARDAKAKLQFATELVSAQSATAAAGQVQSQLPAQ